MARTLAQKLLLKPGGRVRVVNAPGDVALGELPEGAAPAAPGEAADVVLLFVQDSSELARHAESFAEAAHEDSAAWVAYPKGASGRTTDISRDRGWEPLVEAGLVGVTLVAVDDTWSAMRFRPA
ncbi:MAG TPA: hypothetical protein VGJ70_00510 [Solirubrobacteraceae bacterium]|jgi:hypothetical protein